MELIRKCAWQPDRSGLAGGWCTVCRSPTKYDSEGNECTGYIEQFCTDYHCPGDCGLAGHGYQHVGVSDVKTPR